MGAIITPEAARVERANRIEHAFTTAVAMINDELVRFGRSRVTSDSLKVLGLELSSIEFRETIARLAIAYEVVGWQVTRLNNYVEVLEPETP